MEDKRVLFQLTILSLLLATLATSCLFEIIVPAPPEDVVIKSFHDRYVIASAAEEDSTLGQEDEFSNCGWFTLEHLANGKVTLKSCDERYITAPDPEDGSPREEWLLSLQDELDGCGQFDMYKLGGERVAFRTCAGRFWTAGDGNWPGSLAWSVVAETDYLDAWEIFTLQSGP
jgi:hypothetical protein